MVVDKREIKALREKILSQKDSPEYNQRRVLPLKAVGDWSARDIKIQKKYNRLLLGYSDLTADTIIDIAKVTKEGWLTDFVCPRAENACKLNIAADLVTQFKVSTEELNAKSQQIFQVILGKDPDFIKKIEVEVDTRMKARDKEIKDNAQTRLRKIYPDLLPNSPGYDSTLSKFIIVESQRAKKAITNKVVREKLQPLYATYEAEFGLVKKPTHIKGENVDYSILGAAGSGKSTISKILIKEDKLNCVVLATDDYRGVTLNDSGHEAETKQVFTRTQDTAYAIKELVEERLTSPSSKERPNVIIDCVSLEPWHRKLLENNKQTHSAVACLNDISLVPSRAYLRALDPTSGPADKGRQANTSALLKGHAAASAYLLTGIPMGMRTNLYDTNVERGITPPVMARINTQGNNRQIEVEDLSRLSSFLAKSNVNIEASYKGDLYYDKKRDYAVVNDSQYRAEQVLKLIPKAEPYKKENYELLLQTKAGSPYAKISMIDNQLQLTVLDNKALKEVLNDNFPQSDGWLLKSMILQMHFGSINKVREVIKEQGREAALAIAMKQVIPDITLKQDRPKMAFQSDVQGNLPLHKEPRSIKSSQERDVTVPDSHTTGETIKKQPGNK